MPKEPGKKQKTKKILWEKYLAGVVSAEVTCQAPQEALRAQAVLARSFALYRRHQSRVLGRPFDIRAGTMAQAIDRKGASSDCVHSVHRTRGKVLAVGNLLVEALYHASCGGSTASAQEVYGHPAAGFQAVACGWCDGEGTRVWNHALGRNELARRFAIMGGLPGIQGVSISKKSKRGRVLEVGLLSASGGLRLSAARLRTILGERLVRSTVFRIENTATHLVFTGKGYGHGVGLCQEGMLAMARAGWGWKRILKHYYPAAVIRTVHRP